MNSKTAVPTPRSRLGRLPPSLHLPPSHYPSMKGSSPDTCNLAAKPYPPPRSSATSNIKLLCSYGGKILPRYPDGKLRYNGGETRVLSVSRSISFAGQFMLLLHSNLFLLFSGRVSLAVVVHVHSIWSCYKQIKGSRLMVRVAKDSSVSLLLKQTDYLN